jgi:hypothetical protein
MKSRILMSAVCLTFIAIATNANAANFFFSTGSPDGLMAAASRPDSAGKFEIESADDFVTSSTTSITSATFTGLLPTNARLSDVTSVNVEIYRVFPKDSDVGRTSGAPTFSTPQVTTRVNSPSDVAFTSRDSVGGGLTFTPGIVSPSFTTNNSVAPGGIHPIPGLTTGGNGAVTGQEVSFNVLFTTALLLPADHYFFVPQVQLANGDFYWLSAPRPIVPPGTTFPPGNTDLQGWTRDQFLDPDWARVGTDIVGGGPAPTFNFTFSLTGDPIVDTTPIPAALPLFASGLGVIGLFGWRRKRTGAALAA